MFSNLLPKYHHFLIFKLTNKSTIISQIQISRSALIVVSYELFTKYILAIVMKIYKNIKNIGYFFK